MARQEKKFQPKTDIGAIADLSGRVPPQDIEIEEAVLGALLLEPEVVPDVLDQLQSDCFYKEQHAKIFGAICTLSTRNEPVDILSVSNELRKNGELEAVGGMAYLSALTNKIGAAAHIDYHSKVLLQKFLQRELIRISYDVQKAAYDDTLPVDELVDTAEEKIFTLAERNVHTETKSITSIINRAVAQIEENQKREDGLSGVPSGYTGIDQVTFGWHPGDLIILAARPAVGKTAFVLTMARNMAVDHKVPVAIFSLEMPDTQLVTRLFVGETRLPSDKLRGARKLTEADWKQLHDGLNLLSQAPLWIDDTPSLSIYEFRSKARRLVQKNGVKMIIIDYLQLMAGPPELKGMREQEVAAISRSLKAIAKELGVPILALSQLSRAVETRGGNKRPQLSDLRESGAIEQDADIVMFIHRPEYVGTADSSTYPGQTELIIAKHRNGEVKDVNMKFESSLVRFVDANDGWQQPEAESSYATYESRMNAFQDGDDMPFNPSEEF